MVTKTAGTKEWATSNVNFCLGCSNDCNYCYAKAMSHRFNRKSRDDWKNMELLEHMANKKFRKREGWIMSPSSHDITKDNALLALKVFKNILAAGNNLLIVTKPDYYVISYLNRFLTSYRHQILYRFTITTLQDYNREHLESKTSPCVSSRLKSLASSFLDGYKTSVSAEPFLDESVIDLVKTVYPFVTDKIWLGPMNFTHVPKKYITTKLKSLYSPLNLLRIKTELDKSRYNDKILYKDHYLNRIQELHKWKASDWLEDSN